MTFSGIIGFLGGIGLFLLGMRLMTEGLKVAAGPGLRNLLTRGTTTRLRAVGSGFAITSLVQSSSAVTFATIGFVNAGLLALPAAVGVIYGANLGTTVTSWLVAMVGFKLDLKLLAMPAIALGMAMRIGFGARREGALGEALAGFGVFFIGIDVLKEAFSGLSFAFEPDASETAHLLLPYVGIGFVMTLVMQSSSAALVVTLSAAASGVLPLPAAAAMVIGANVGTTTTAVFAVIGATAPAKRAAAAHVIFNLVVAVAALVTFPVLLWSIANIGNLLQGHPLAAATALALFHTMTKLIGIVLMWPVTNQLTDWLEGRLRGVAKDLYAPRFLDRNIAETPALALDAVVRELERAMEIARMAATRAITVPNLGRADVQEACSGLNRLVVSIGEFATVINDPERADTVAAALRVNQYLADVAERTVEFMQFGERVGQVGNAEVAAVLVEVNTRAQAVLAGAGDMASIRAEFEMRYQAAKSELLRAGADRRVPVGQMVAALDQISALRRLVDQFTKAAQVLMPLVSLGKSAPQLE